MTKYKTVYGFDPGDLDSDVNIMLKKGWNLYRNPRSVFSEFGSIIHYQSLTKETEE